MYNNFWSGTPLNNFLPFITGSCGDNFYWTAKLGTICTVATTSTITYVIQHMIHIRIYIYRQQIFHNYFAVNILMLSPSLLLFFTPSISVQLSFGDHTIGEQKMYNGIIHIHWTRKIPEIWVICIMVLNFHSKNV